MFFRGNIFTRSEEETVVNHWSWPGSELLIMTVQCQLLCSYGCEEWSQCSSVWNQNFKSAFIIPKRPALIPQIIRQNKLVEKAFSFFFFKHFIWQCHSITLVLVKILPKVRQNLQKKRENSCTQVDDVTLIRPTISMSWGRLETEPTNKRQCTVCLNVHVCFMISCVCVQFLQLIDNP